MGRSQETFNKKEVRRNKEKKRKAKEKKKEARKEGDKGNVDDMIAYVDENGMITSTPPDPDKKKEEIDIEGIEISVPKRDPSMDADPIRTGTVSYYNDSKGYGFIRDSVTKESIFVHINNVLEEIKEGNAVSFEVVKGQKGPTAVEVKVLKQ